MTTRPEFDPERSAAVKRMLMDTVKNSSFGIRKQITVLLSLSLAGVIVAGGTAAWALSSGIIVIPASAPLASHSATASPAPVSSPIPPPAPVIPAGSHAPVPRVPVSCSDLASRDSIATLFSGAILGSDSPYSFPDGVPEYAAFQQAGGLECLWYQDVQTDSNILSLHISTDPASGRSDIAAQQSTGQASFGVGQISAYECGKVSTGCSASLVSGNYWLTLEYEGDATSYGDAQQKMAAIAKRMVAALNRHPIPRPAWTMPTNSWEPVPACSTLMTDRQASDLTSTPGISLVTLNRGSTNGILWTVPDIRDCSWRVPDNVSVTAGQTSAISVEIVPGAKWAYEQVTGSPNSGHSGTQVSVAGAEDARFECQSPEGGEFCWLDVLTGNSWMQVGGGDSMPRSSQNLLIRVAETIIASPH